MAACTSSSSSSSFIVFFCSLPTVRCSKPYLFSSVHHSLKASRRQFFTLPAVHSSSASPSISSSVCFSFSTIRTHRSSSIIAASYSSSSSSSSSLACLPMDQQFEEFRVKLEESGSLREKLRVIVADLDTVTRLMQAQLLLVHHSRPSPETLAKVKAHIDQVRTIYRQLAEVLKSVPGQYYRYHDHWRNQTYTVVFLLAFIHWLETGGLLSHSEAASLLGLQDEEFELDLEDYLVGLCNLSNELPRYVVNQVTTGDYDCAKRASVFLSDLYAAFRMLNLRNDLLRKRFDGMKYDLKKVEEVLYDVKIRGLLGDPTQNDHTT